MTPKSRIKVRFDELPSGRLLATSSDLPSLMISGASPLEFANTIPEAVRELYAASEVAIVVTGVRDLQNGLEIMIEQVAPQQACA
jgi:hypothetical protein